MKLINANRLKDAITKTRMNCQKAQGADYKEGVIETLEVIERTLADMPAEYDVEKVINKLKDAKDTPRDDSFIEKLTTRMWNKAIDEAIRIVEKGGWLSNAQFWTEAAFADDDGLGDDNAQIVVNLDTALEIVEAGGVNGTQR